MANDDDELIFSGQLSEAIGALADLKTVPFPTVISRCDDVLATFAKRVGPHKRARYENFVALRLAIENRMEACPARQYACALLDRALTRIRLEHRHQSAAAYREAGINLELDQRSA